MKKLLAIFLFSTFTLTGFAQNFEPLDFGAKIPNGDTKMKGIDEKSYSIIDVMGKNGVLVMFSCNTCPYVVKYQARTLEAIKTAKENGFGVIIINSNEAYRQNEDSYAAMKEYAKSQGYKNVPYVVDNNSSMANAFGATRTPECFLFNSLKTLVYHGAIDDNQNATEAKRKHLYEAMVETAQGREVSVKETRSIGCTIKRS